jgi:hypothetical protein
VVTEIFDNDLCPIPGSLFNEVFKILHPIWKKSETLLETLTQDRIFENLLNAMNASTKSFQLLKKKANGCVESFD